jgi:hypothetical protein
MLWVDEPDWSDETRTVLVEALATSFWSSAAITDLVTTVGLGPADIPVSGTSREIWSQLVRRADEVGALRRLVEKAAGKIPASDELKRVLAASVESRTYSVRSPPVAPVASPRHRTSPESGLASRLHEVADTFDHFVGLCTGGTRLDSGMEGDRRALLQAWLVDVRRALNVLGDEQLRPWPDKGFVVTVRPRRDSARDLEIELRGILARGERPDAEVRRLVASLVRVRDLIREQVPVQPEGGRPRR